MGRVHAEAVRRLGSVEPVPVGGRDESAFRAALANPGITGGPHLHAECVALSRWPRPRSKPGSMCCARSRWRCRPPRRDALVALAQAKRLRNCTCHNLRYYPMVQQMRRMREAGDWEKFWWCRALIRRIGCCTIPTGTGGSIRRRRAVAGAGRYRLALLRYGEHVTGQRITRLCADLQTFHKTRKRPKVAVETFCGQRDDGWPNHGAVESERTSAR